MTRITGEKGEKIACKYLKKIGIKILERNYRAVRGEIDIIGQDEDCLVFFEVKTNSAPSDIPPESRVNTAKQKQIGKIARAYLQNTEQFDKDCRFDVIGITMVESEKPVISHIRNAFWLPGNV
ncbi:MAG: YraN family protein [bacterium]|nr:YraN family protein [bacterium]